MSRRLSRKGRCENPVRVLHWFRNDLRLQNNAALAFAAQRASTLTCAFIFDERLLRRAASSPARVRFMLDCVERLRATLRKRGSELMVRWGHPREQLLELVDSSRAELVCWNRDYTPYAKKRDAAIERALEQLGIGTHVCKDRVVWEGSELLTQSGKPFTVYSPFRRAWWRRFEAEPPPRQARLRLPPPARIARGKLPSISELGADADAMEMPTGGEEAASRRLRTFLAKRVEHYARDRDLPFVDGTSRLSPYLRFGAISVRTCIEQALAAAEANSSCAAGAQKWIDELIWREFYTAILDANPRVLGQSFRTEYNEIRWDDDPAHWEAW